MASGRFIAVPCLGWKAVAQRCVSPSNLWIPRANAITPSFAFPLPQLRENFRAEAIVLFMKINRLTPVEVLCSVPSALLTAKV